MRFLRSKLQTTALILASALALTGCSWQSVRPEQALDGAGGGAVSFVNRVWQVENSSGVAPGTLYVFLSEGTLLITSANSTPLLGTWKYEGGELTMVEEGRPYKTDILQLSADEFRIRSNNPGEPVEVRLVPAKPDALRCRKSVRLTDRLRTAGHGS
ncbi:MAG: lipocalin family protein [Pseudomonadota bacterium]|nr:lipocalin family protein [Burkholderiales bacterium]MDQ3197127.1 lipocalin family protein [Pseudomonadota bacterium]